LAIRVASAALPPVAVIATMSAWPSGVSSTRSRRSRGSRSVRRSRRTRLIVASAAAEASARLVAAMRSGVEPGSGDAVVGSTRGGASIGWNRSLAVA
jgi:hypothetical protein